jgi:hypothetical protein
MSFVAEDHIIVASKTKQWAVGGNNRDYDND